MLLENEEVALTSENYFDIPKTKDNTDRVLQKTVDCVEPC